MIDVVGYLESKGFVPKVANSNNIHVPCFFCGEDIDDRGRLYISVDPTLEPYGMFFCFLCGMKGTFNTIRKHFGDTPVERASEKGLDKDNFLPDDTFCDILNVSAEYFHDKLMENAEAYHYLAMERGFTHATIVKFQLGWDDGGLTTHLVQKGFMLDDITRTGLVSRFGSDFLANKITIPYVTCGQVVCIRGKEIGGKYLTPPGQKARLFNSDSLLMLSHDLADARTVVHVSTPEGSVDESSLSETDSKPSRALPPINLDSRKFAVIAEGEGDTMMLDQLGFIAVGVPGANTWQDNWSGYFEEARRVFVCFDNDDAGRAGAEKVATKLGLKARIVEMPKALPGQKKIDVNSWVTDHGKGKDDFDFLFSKSKGGLLVTVREAYSRWLEVEGNPGLQGLRFNIKDIDKEMRHGLLPAQVVTAISKTGTGKSHPIDYPIPTPDGFSAIGDLEVGSLVFGSNGEPTKVTGVFDRGILPTYQVAFSDGTHTECGPDHIWTVYYRETNRKRDWVSENKTTLEIIQDGLKHRNEWKYRIPMTAPVSYDFKDLPIEPYTLGALIANGSLSGVSVVLTTSDEDVINRISLHHEIRENAGHSCYRYVLPGLIEPIWSLGLCVKSAQKFIPEVYLKASTKQRIALLHGLMDGDGSVEKTRSGRSVMYHTTSPQLALDVRRLVNSLGGTASMRSVERQGENGTYTEYSQSIMLPETISPFSTERKTYFQKSTYKTEPRRAIISIELVGYDQHRCIQVDALDSLYLAGKNYAVTHNTTLTINLFHRMSLLKPDIKILFVSLEQTRNEWFERAHRINCFYNPEASHTDTVKYWEDKLMIMDKNRISQAELEGCIDQYEYELGYTPDIVAVDYLGYYARSFKGEEYARVTDAVMGLKEMAKDKRCIFFAPSQVNRTGSFGKDLTADQAKSSGAVEETSDMLLSIVNPDQRVEVRPEEQERVINLRVLKSRDGGIGQIAKLQFAPLTLALVPMEDPLYARALAEKKYASHGDSFEEAVYRHRTGDESIHLGGAHVPNS